MPVIQRYLMMGMSLTEILGAIAIDLLPENPSRV